MTTSKRSLPHQCSFVAEIFGRETNLRQRLPFVTEPNVLSGITIAVAELAKLRRDHANACPSCAAIEDGRLARAA